MRHAIFDNRTKFKAAIAIKESAFSPQQIQKEYLNYLGQRQVDVGSIIAFSLDYNSANKAPVGTVMSPCITNLLSAANHVGVEIIYVADAAYFKKLTGLKKAEPSLGYALPCAIEGYEHIKIMLGVNYQAVFHNPDNETKLRASIKAFKDFLGGTLIELGSNILHHAEYPSNLMEIKNFLNKLHDYPYLTADIEAFGLKLDTAHLGSIAFAWDKHSGGAFPIDAINQVKAEFPTGRKHNGPVRKLLKEFLCTYKGILVWHNANFDLKILIYELFMEDYYDYEGMLEGIRVLTKRFKDTKIISYLALNSCGGSHARYSLKNLAQQYAGNYSQSDIEDIRKIPLGNLLRYNIIDCLATHYVLEKYEPVMIADNQEQVLNDIFMPSVPIILQMELTGMPLDMDRVLEVEQELNSIIWKHRQTLLMNPIVQKFEQRMREALAEEYNNTHKVKRKVASDFHSYRLNPNSAQQLQDLLYIHMNYPVIDRTDTGQPSTSGDTIKKLINRTNKDAALTVLHAIRGIADASKITSTFIEAFKNNSIKKSDGIYWLHGSFNLGGTVSGRLSSSGPNLQNMPSGSMYGKLIKSCFRAPPGWIMVGADFASLEDRISALTTKDPNKLKVYTDGYDGHCLRAYSYFKEEMPDIVETVESINSIEQLYPHFRKNSKAPTFALTYQGTYRTLMNNLGWTQAKSKKTEKAFQELYKVSVDWVNEHIKQAKKDGYGEVAFGLRLRTPLLGKTKGKMVTNEAKAEGRTFGNALGQSWGMLNNRAAIELTELMERDKLQLSILPIAHIHDAQYFIVKESLSVVEWLNTYLPKCMLWQEAELIKHDKVKLGGDLEIYHPNWANKIVLPNYATANEIKKLCGDSNE